VASSHVLIQDHRGLITPQMQKSAAQEAAMITEEPVLDALALAMHPQPGRGLVQLGMLKADATHHVDEAGASVD
jgi:hypothetical protein